MRGFLQLVSRGTDWLTGSDRHEKARERIYEAATTLAATRGLDRLNVDDIAKRAGCSRATVYRHAGGKDGIRDVVLARAAGRVVQAVRDAVEKMTGRDRVVAGILLSLRAVRADPIFIALAQAGTAASLLDQKLAESPQLSATAAAITGLPDDDRLGAQWIVRVMLALMFWPAGDVETEEAMVRRFVGAGFSG